MNRYISDSITVLCCLLVSGGIIRAQSAALPFVAMSFDSVEAGMAGCSLTDVGISKSNPTYSVMNDKMVQASAAWMNMSSSGSRTSYFSAGGGVRIKEKYAVSLNATYGLCEAYEIFNSGGYSLGMYRPYQLIAGVGFSYRPLKFLSVGVNLKYAGEKLYEEANYAAFVSDIALSSDLPLGQKGNIKLTAGVYSLGTRLKSLDGNAYSLPSSVRAEIAYFKVFSDKHRVGAVCGTNVFLQKNATVSIAVWYDWNSMLTFRGGYHYGNASKGVIPSYASLGLGVKFFGVSIDAAYLFGSEILKNSFGVSLGYEF